MGKLLRISAPGSGKKYFLISITSPDVPFNGYRELVFLGAKRLGRGVNHSPPGGAKIKNEWSYTYTPEIKGFYLIRALHKQKR